MRTSRLEWQKSKVGQMLAVLRRRMEQKRDSEVDSSQASCLVGTAKFSVKNRFKQEKQFCSDLKKMV